MRKIGLLGRQLVAPMLLALGAGVANAAVMTYDEAVSGDLSNPPLTTLAFDVGVNTISGNTGLRVAANGVSSTEDVDPFEFAVPTGTQIVGAQLFMAQAVGGTLSTDWYLYSGSFYSDPESTLVGQFSITATNTTVVLPSPSYGPGTYSVLPGYMAYGGAASADYTFTFTLREANENPVPVPEPATPLLLAGALLAATAVGRRARR